MLSARTHARSRARNTYGVMSPAHFCSHKQRDRERGGGREGKKNKKTEAERVCVERGGGVRVRVC